MDTAELQKLANRTRSMREAGIALLLASGILGVFFLSSSAPKAPPSALPVVIATTTTEDAFAHVPIKARAAIVYDLSTHQVLYAKNADAQLPLASLTKLLTMYAAFSEFATSTPITIPTSVMGLSEPHAFQPGETFALADLARITLTGSLNDGAAAIAQATAEQEKLSTHQLLASVTSALDLSQTYALNGNGLDMNTAISGGYGSAHDVAVLAGAFAALEPAVASATTHPVAQAQSAQGQLFTIHNTDPIVENVPGLLLSKTGYTDLAGGNLALVFNVGIGHPIAVVVLGSTIQSRFTDGMALVDATFAHFAGVPSL